MTKPKKKNQSPGKSPHATKPKTKPEFWFTKKPKVKGATKKE